MNLEIKPENQPFMHPASGDVQFTTRPKTEDVKGSQPRKTQAPPWWNDPIDGIKPEQPELKETRVPLKKSKKPPTQVPAEVDPPALPDPAAIETPDITLHEGHPQAGPAGPAELVEEFENRGLHDLVPPEYQSAIGRAVAELAKMTLVKETFDTFGVHFYEFSPGFKEQVQDTYVRLCQQYLWSGRAYRALHTMRPIWSPGKLIQVIQRALGQMAFIQTLSPSNEQEV